MSSREEIFKFDGDHAHWPQAKGKFMASSLKKRINFVLRKAESNTAEVQERGQEEEDAWTAAGTEEKPHRVEDAQNDVYAMLVMACVDSQPGLVPRPHLEHVISSTCVCDYITRLHSGDLLL